MLRIDDAAIVDLVEASYTAPGENESWVDRVLDTVMRMSGSRSAVVLRVTTAYDAEGHFRVEKVQPPHVRGEFCSPWSDATARAIVGAPGGEAMFGRTQGATGSDASGLGAQLSLVPGFHDCWREPIVDALGLISRDARGDCFVVCAGLDETTTLSRREASLLAKLATHLGAAERLRRPNPVSRVERAEAILSPDGKVLHADGAAKERRALLDDGRRRRNVARKTRHDADLALETWRGLVAGRWSLVDHFDNDGKRFLLAMKNAPQVDPSKDLTPRERRTCSLAAMGNRDKEIAYMLGISLASVTAALHRARAKLGVSSRAELAAVWRRAGG